MLRQVQFQPILTFAKARDINESDNVVIGTDLTSPMFGCDKYSEITSEHMIRGTFCDLAVKLDGKLSLSVGSESRSVRRSDGGVFLSGKRL